MKIVDAVLDSTNTHEQQVLAFRLAVRHRLLSDHLQSAGIANDDSQTNAKHSFESERNNCVCA